MNNKVLIIYHSEDNDGIVSGVLCKISVENTFSDKKIVCQGYTYAQLSKLILKYKSVKDFAKKLHCEYSELIMTDISFNETDVMKSLYNEFGETFYWFDHHTPAIKTSEEKGYDHIPGFRVHGTCSAIKCVWEYLFNKLYSDSDTERIPKFLNALSAYDSWNWDQHGVTFDFCNCVNKGFNIESENDFDKTYAIIKVLIENLDKNNINIPTVHEQQLLMKCYTTGKTLIGANSISNKALLERWGDCSFILDNGEKSCVLFTQNETNSDTFKTLRESDVKHGVVFRRIPNSGDYTLSLYNINSDDTFNCGEYLKKKYNGGGHKGAGGATILKEQFNQIMLSKSI